MIAVGAGQVQGDLAVFTDVEIVGCDSRRGRTIGAFDAEDHQVEGSGRRYRHRVSRGFSDDCVDSALVGGIAVVQIRTILSGAMEEIEAALGVGCEDEVSVFVENAFVTRLRVAGAVVPVSGSEELLAVVGRAGLRRLVGLLLLDRHLAGGRLAVDCRRDRRRSGSDARDVSVFIDRCDLLVGAAPCDGLVGSVLRLDGGHLNLFALALDQGEGRLVQGDFVCEDVLFVHGHVVGLSEIEKLALDRSCRLEIGSFDIAEIFDDAEISDSEGELIGKTRHIFRFDRLCGFEEELLKQLNPHYSRVHFVSKRLNCILSVHDQRGCDIVFFDKRYLKRPTFCFTNICSIMT